METAPHLAVNGSQLATMTVQNAVRSMLYEVTTTPKPGLVDPASSGPHPDMDAFDFINSSISLIPYLQGCFEAGWTFKGADLHELFAEIRPLGVTAEKTMLQATNQVNTHKGAVFSLGVLVAATGYLFGTGREFKATAVSEIAQQMLAGLIAHDFAGVFEKPEETLTAGERQFIKYGETGIRGEAEKGYPTVLGIGLPFLRQATGARNQRLLDTLLKIVSQSRDSNLIKRAGSQKIVTWAHQEADQFLALGGSQTDAGMQKLIELNHRFLERNLSLGGSADLLILTIYFALMEKSLS